MLNIKQEDNTPSCVKWRIRFFLLQIGVVRCIDAETASFYGYERNSFPSGKIKAVSNSVHKTALIRLQDIVFLIIVIEL